MADSIKLALETSKRIAVEAKGHPANIVAYGAAAAVVFVGIAVGYGMYEGTRGVFRGIQGKMLKRAAEAAAEAALSSVDPPEV